MVSLLWKACSEGDLQNVHELLKEATSVDIEIKGSHYFPWTTHDDRKSCRKHRATKF